MHLSQTGRECKKIKRIYKTAGNFTLKFIYKEQNDIKIDKQMIFKNLLSLLQPHKK